MLLSCLWALAAALFSAVALLRLRAQASGARAPGEPPPVLLLRPVDAPTPAELRALVHPVDYAGALEQVVLSPEPPGVPLPQGMRWLASEPLTPNRKVGHLQHALRVLRPSSDGGRVVLAVDADVAVTGALVEALARPVAAGAPLCSAAWTPVAAAGPRGVGGLALEGLLRHTHHSFHALHAMSAGAPAISGKALALSPEAMALLPGLGEHIGEDLELSSRLHARGLRPALAPAVARVPLLDPLALRPALARISRWMQVLRSHRPALYPTVPLLFAPTPVLLLLALLLDAAPLWLALLPLGAVRCALSLRLGQLSGEGERGGMRAFGWLAGEGLLLAAFVDSLLRGGRVTWRGRRFQLSAGGRMRPLATGAPEAAHAPVGDAR
nr:MULTISPECIES: glycosyltransferase [Myxococcaceae]